MDITSYLLGKKASGGGGSSSGLTYEEGVWTPTEDIYRHTIYFNKTHKKPPFFIAVSDVTGGESTTEKRLFSYMYFDNYQLFGVGIPSKNPSELGPGYAFKGTTGRNTTTTNYEYSYLYLHHTSEEQEHDHDVSYPRYWTTNTMFKAGYVSTVRYWEAGRTYKWIAIWMNDNE